MSSSVDLSVATRLRSILSLPTVRRVCSAYSCCRPPPIKTNVCENRALMPWNQLSWLSRRVRYCTWRLNWTHAHTQFSLEHRCPAKLLDVPLTFEHNFHTSSRIITNNNIKIASSMTLVKSSDWNEASASWFPMAIIQEVKLRATLLGHNCVEMAGMWKSNGNIFFILKRYTWLCIALEYDNKSVFDYSFSFFPQISRYWLPDGWRTSVNLDIWNIMHILFKWR